MATKKLKIVILGPGYPYRNGPSIYLSILCKQLSLNFNVELINYKMLYPGFLFPGKTQYSENDNEATFFSNIRLVNSLNPISWIKTAKYIKKLNPDLIAFDWWHPFFALCHTGIIYCLPKYLRKKVMFITENVISHEANKIDKILTRIALSNAHCFLALSNNVKNYLGQLFDKKIFISELPLFNIYSHKEDEFKNNALHGNRVELLFFGIVRKYKGLDLLLEAFGKLASNHFNINLKIVGEFYEDIDPYLKIIKKNDLENRVEIIDRYVPDEEVEKYFIECSAVVLPYRSATQSAVLTVAYSYSKPVIVTNVGDLGAFVEDGKTGIVTEPTVEGIANGILKFSALKEQNFPFENNIHNYLKAHYKFEKVNEIFENIVLYINNK